MCIHTYGYVYIHTYIHTRYMYIYIYIHTYTHLYTHTLISPLNLKTPLIRNPPLGGNKYLLLSI